MTEKRFSKYVPDICNGYTVAISIVDNETGKQSASVGDFVDLLNELHEEKEDLVTKKEDAEYELLHLKEKYEELLEENEQLKQFIQELTTKGTGKIHLANGSIYKVDAILINIKG